MIPTEEPQKKARIAKLARKLSDRMGVSSIDAILYALKTALAQPTHEDFEEETAAAILKHAHELWDTSGRFTMDELLLSIYGPDRIIESVRGLKILIGKVLRSDNFQCSQMRHRGGRPLVWYRALDLDFLNKEEE